MAISHTEKAKSRECKLSMNGEGSITLFYTIKGSENENEIFDYIESDILLAYTFDGLLFQDARISPQGTGVWDCELLFNSKPRRVEATSNGGPGGPDWSSSVEPTTTFDTTGSTAHITQALETIDTYIPLGGSNAPDFKGAIGVNDGGVEGCDVITPKFEFAETHYLPTTTMTQAYISTLVGLTGRTNDASFRGFSIGEVLFLGATGTLKGLNQWEITYKFACSKNRTDISVANVTGIAKKGWEYLWTRFKTSTSENQFVQELQSVHIVRVYDSGDFSLLGI